MAEASESRPDERRIDAEGESVGEAKWSAIKQLEPRFPGLTAECVRFQVLADGEDGQPARVAGEVDVDAWRAAAAGDMPEDPVDRLRALVTRVVQSLGLRGTVEVTETEEEIKATVEGDELGLLIGKHGATIDALQHLAVRIVLREGRRDKRVVIDAAGYRDRREKALRHAADRGVAEATRYGRPVELEPMRALERKVVHTHLHGRSDITTHSEGDEPDRRLVITPVDRPSP